MVDQHFADQPVEDGWYTVAGVGANEFPDAEGGYPGAQDAARDQWRLVVIVVDTPDGPCRPWAVGEEVPTECRSGGCPFVIVVSGPLGAVTAPPEESP